MYERIKCLCEAHGFSISSIGENIPGLNITSASVSGWKRGAIPRSKVLKLIADYFGVTIEYLKGETENPSVENDKGDREWTVYAMDGEPGAQTVNININTFDEINELLKVARNLPVEKIRLLAEVAKAMQ